MKVSIYETVNVTDEQRIQIAAEIDGEGAKKRNATRDEMKEFIWREGSNWASALSGEGEPDEDLIGGGEPDEDLIGGSEPDDESLI